MEYVSQNHDTINKSIQTFYKKALATARAKGKI